MTVVLAISCRLHLRRVFRLLPLDNLYILEALNRGTGTLSTERALKAHWTEREFDTGWV